MNDLKKYQSFELPNTLKVVMTDNQLLKLIITNPFCDAEIYLHGAHLTHFQPKGEDALIFDAKESKITPPHSVHAGIPICWPWFGPHPSDESKPQHGFARDLAWEIRSTKTLPAQETEIVLSLQDSAFSHELFDFSFSLELTFILGSSCTLSLKTLNSDQKSFTVTQALHSYFAISDVSKIEIRGVEGTPFIDYTDKKKEKVETTPLHIDKETNRVYLPTKESCYIYDSGHSRKIVVEKEGSNSTTIWNPWSDQKIHDLPDDKYRHFVCIESTNALSDSITLKPGETHTITQKISVESL